MIKHSVLLLLSLFLLSCKDESTGSVGTNGGLEISNGRISIGLNGSDKVIVRGGEGLITVDGIDDPAVAQLEYSGRYYEGTVPVQYFQFIGKQLGSTKVRFVDQQKGATGQVFIDVVPIAASPSSIIVEQYRSSYFVVTGGTAPYRIVQSPDSAVAVANSFTNEIAVEPVGPGSTSVMIADNAVPPHILSVPITVTPGTWFTSPGLMTLSSNMFQMSVNDIMPAPRGFASREHRGAGAFVIAGLPASIVVEAYQTLPSGQTNFIVVQMWMDEPAIGPFTITLPMLSPRKATVYIGNDAGAGSRELRILYLTEGEGNISMLSADRMVMSFRGSGGYLTSSSRKDIVIYDASFDVPVLRRQQMPDGSVGVLPQRAEDRTLRTLHTFAKKLRDRSLRQRWSDLSVSPGHRIFGENGPEP